MKETVISPAHEGVAVGIPPALDTSHLFSFEEIFHSLPNGIIVCTQPKDSASAITCLFANRAAEKFFPVKYSPFTGKNLLKIISLAEDETEKFFSFLESKENFSITKKIFDEDIYLTFSHSGQYFSVVLDYSPEKNISSEEKFLRDIQRTSPGFLFILDLDNQRITDGNGKLEEYLGYAKEYFGQMHDPIRQLVHIDDIQTVYCHLQKFFSAGGDEFLELEYRIRTANNEWRWLHTKGKIYRRDDHGLPTHIIVNAEDISERKIFLQELERQREFLLESQEIAGVGSFVWDMRNDTDHAETPELRRIFCADDSEKMDYEYFSQILHPDDRARVQETIEEAIRDRKNYSCEYRIICKGGKEKIVQTNGRIIFSDDGRPLRMIGTVLDITEKRSSNEILREREFFVQKIADTTPGLIGVYNIRTGKYVFASSALQRILGYPPETFTKGGIEFVMSLVHPDDLPGIIEKNRIALEEAMQEPQRKDISQTFEYRMLAADGSYRWLHTTGTIFDRNSNGEIEHILNISIDITERKEAEKKLAEQENFLHAITDAAPNIIYLYDLIEEKYLYTNKDLYETLGYTRADIDYNYSETLRKLVHPDDQMTIIEQILKIGVAHDGEMIEDEFRIRHKNGEWRWINTRSQIFKRTEDGKPCQIVGTAQDITDRKRNEKKIHDNEHFIQAVTDAVPNIIFVYDIYEKKNLFVNKEIFSLLGYDQADLRNQDFTQLKIHPDDQAMVLDRIRRYPSLADGEVFESEYRLMHADGSWRWLNSRVQVFKRDEKGNVWQVIGSSKDVTDRIIAQENLRKLNSELEEIIASRTEELRLSEAKLKEAQRLAKVGNWEFDITTGNVQWSEEIYRIHGRAVEDGPPSYEELLSSYTDPQQLQKSVQYAIENGEPYGFDAEIKLPDGERKFIHAIGRPYFENGKCVRLYGATMDITERKIPEIELQKSREEFAAIFQQAIVGIAQADTTGRFVMVNDHFCDIVQRTREELLKLKMQDITHPDDLQDNMKMFSNAIEFGEGFYIEKRYVRPDGKIVWVHNSVTPIRNADGDVQTIAAVCRDVTRKKLLKRNYAEVRSSSRLLRMSCPCLCRTLTQTYAISF